MMTGMRNDDRDGGLCHGWSTMRGMRNDDWDRG
jgi:hypothetical protein